MNIFASDFLQKTTLQLTNSEKKWLDKNKMIKIASLSSWPKNEKDQNIHTEYLNLLRKYGNINIYNVEFESWNEAYENTINNDFIHGILYLSWSKERSEKYFNYIPPYSFVPVNLVVKKDNNTIKSLKDLENSSIYTLKKSISNVVIKESGLNIKTIPLESEEELIKALASPNPQAKAILTFNYTPNRFKNKNLKIVKRIQNRYGNVHIGVSKKQTFAYSILKKAHNNIPKDELVKIQNHRFILKSNQFIQQLNGDEQAYLSKKTNITMCVDPDWEPYEKIDKDGDHVGLAADFIKLIEHKINKQIKLIPTKTWHESLEFAKKGKCEILSFLNQTSNRDKFLDFTSTIYEEPDVIIAKDDVTYLDGINSLKGKTIALVKGYKMDEYIKQKHLKINIRYVKNDEEAIKLVSKGDVYATINPLLGTAHLIRKLSLIDIKIAGKTNLLNQFKIGVVKDEHLLKNILSKAIKSISEKEKEKILANWLSIRYEQVVNYNYIWKISIVFVLILLGLYYRQYAINKINKDLERKMKLQLEQIIQKDRMIFEQNKLVAMGEMIENIAHQWRQPLSQINSAVLLLDDELYNLNINNHLIEEKLLEIESQTKYMSGTIDDFKNFYSNTKEKKEFLLDKSILNVLSIIRASFSYNNIKLEVDLLENIPSIGYSNELEQAILVILNNAKDAFNLKNIDNPKVKIILSLKENKKIIQICDNAGGIDKNIIDKVFDPYFTTKHKSQGTGLGLYISKMIIEQSYGKLYVKNQNGGACFYIEIGEYHG